MSHELDERSNGTKSNVIKLSIVPLGTFRR